MVLIGVRFICRKIDSLGGFLRIHHLPDHRGGSKGRPPAGFGKGRWRVVGGKKMH